MESLAPLNNLAKILLELRKSIPSATPAIAFLGYTDLMLSAAEWAELGVDESQLANRPNFANLRAIHGRPDVTVVPTLASALQALIGDSFTLTVFDFTQYEGSEVPHDFNFPLPAPFLNAFDIVVDNGTCEHIFNIAQALVNVLKMLRPGGLVYHNGPLCWPNHGFYGYNPTLFADFYEDNGCRLLDLFLNARTFSNGAPHHLSVSGIPKYDHFTLAQALHNNSDLLHLQYNLAVVATKLQELPQTVYPIQHKYRNPADWQ